MPWAPPSRPYSLHAQTTIRLDANTDRASLTGHENIRSDALPAANDVGSWKSPSIGVSGRNDCVAGSYAVHELDRRRGRAAVMWHDDDIGDQIGLRRQQRLLSAAFDVAGQKDCAASRADPEDTGAFVPLDPEPFGWMQYLEVHAIPSPSIATATPRGIGMFEIRTRKQSCRRESCAH